MPKIPTYENQVAISGRSNAVKVQGDPAARFIEQSNRSLQAIGDIAENWFAKRDQARKERALIENQSALAGELDDLEVSFDKDTDYGTIEQRFSTQANALRQSRLDGIKDEDVKLRVEQSWDRLYRAKLNNVRRQAFKLEADDALAGLDNDLDAFAHRASRAGNAAERAEHIQNAQDAIEKMAEVGFITKTAAGNRLRGFVAKLDEADARQLINADPKAAAAALAGSDRFTGIDETRRAVLLDMAQRRGEAIDREADRLNEKAQRERDKVIEEKRQRFLSDFEIALDDGKKGYTDIEQAYADGNLEPRERTRLTLKLNGKMKDEREAQDRIGLVANVLGGAGVLDPKNSDHRKAADDYFARVLLPSLKDQPADVTFNEIAKYSSRVGIIPETARGMIRGGLRAGNDETAYAAADLVERVAARNPQALNDLNDEDLALGHTIMAQVRAGAEPAAAITRARQALTMPANERKLLGERYKADKLPEKNASWLRSEATGGWFSSLPGQAPTALEAEFQDAVRFAYENRTGGDIDAARKLVMSDMRRIWAVTEIGGRARWMKYAPEAVYAPDGNAAWIDEQLRSDVGELADAKTKLFLQADDRTAREYDLRSGAARPSYQVWRVADNGELSPLLKDGKPVRFQPDYVTSPAYARVKADADKSVEQLRTERGATIERQQAAEAMRGGDLSAIDAAAQRANDAADASNQQLEERRAGKRPVAGEVPTRGRINPAIDDSRDAAMGRRFQEQNAAQEARREAKRFERAPTPLRVPDNAAR